MPLQLSTRAKNLIRGGNDIDDTITRRQAFEAADANILYAPGLNTLAQITALKDATSLSLSVLAPFPR